jgi:hypothetical protein
MAVLAIPAPCHISYSTRVRTHPSNSFSAEVPLRQSCGKTSLFDTCTDSEDSHV